MAHKAQTPQLKELHPEDPDALVALGARPLRTDPLSRATSVLGWLLAGLIVWLAYALASRVLAHFGDHAAAREMQVPRMELEGLNELYQNLEQEKRSPVYTDGVEKLKGQLSRTETQLQEMIDNAKPKLDKGKQKLLATQQRPPDTRDMERF